MMQIRRCSLLVGGLLLALGCGACQKKTDGADGKVTKLGSVEVTAQLVDIPGTFPPNDLYDYGYVLKYKVLEVHRGSVEGDTLLIAQYNPLKPRSEAADKRSGEIGGNVKQFAVGDIHRMALELPIDDYYMGPMINKYHEPAVAGDAASAPAGYPPEAEPIYWAVWTNRVVR